METKVSRSIHDLEETGFS